MLPDRMLAPRVTAILRRNIRRATGPTFFLLSRSYYAYYKSTHLVSMVSSTCVVVQTIECRSVNGSPHRLTSLKSLGIIVINLLDRKAPGESSP
jgi:hypothetical protein